MLGNVHPSWCPTCRTEPGEDCPDSGRSPKSVRQRERQQWRTEALREADEYLVEKWEVNKADHAPFSSYLGTDFTVPLHEVVPGVATTYSGRCKCGCYCDGGTEGCHCAIDWDDSTLYPRPLRDDDDD